MSSAAADRNPRHRFLIGAVTLVILLMGFIALGRLPIDLLPASDAPVVRVRIFVPGLGAAAIEEIITRRLESALSGVTGVTSLESVTMSGGVIVNLHLADRRKTEAVRREITVRLAKENSSWPAALDPPTISVIDAASIAAEYTIRSRHHDMLSLRDWVEDEFANKLQELSGVDTIDIEGGVVREILVMPNQRRLAGLGLSFSEVWQAIRKISDVEAVERAPEVKTHGRRVARLSGNVDAVAALPLILPDGESISLSEVAKVTLSREARSENFPADGAKFIKLTVHKLPAVTALDVAERIQSHVEWMRANRLIPEGIDLQLASNRLGEARRALRRVAVALLAGLVLVLLSARLLLGTGRRTAILGVGILSTLQIVFIIMLAFQLTLDVMTLGALALGVGLFGGFVVLVFEKNVPLGPGKLTTINPVIAAAAAMPAALMPVFFVGGELAAGFRDFALVFGGAWLISAVLALILVPAFDARRRHRAVHWRHAAFVRWIVRAGLRYGGLLYRLARYPFITLVGVLVFAGSMTIVLLVAPPESAFLDNVRGGKIILRIQGPEGNRLAALGDDLTQRLRALPGLREVKHSAELSRADHTLRLDELRARELGIDVTAAGKALAIALSGVPAGSFRDAEHRYDLRLRLPPEESDGAMSFGRVLLLGELNDRPAVHLGDVAGIEQTDGPAQIRRLNGIPAIELVVRFAAGFDAEPAWTAMQDLLKRFRLPKGYRLSYGPAGKVTEEDRRQNWSVFGLALLLVFATQVLLHRSIRVAIAVVLTAVAALAGACATPLIFSLSWSPAIELGLLISIGVTAGYATWSVVCFAARRKQEKSLYKNIMWISKYQRRPLLAMTLLAQFGMLSLLLVKGAAIALHPLVMTVVMGLFFSLLANLLILPVLYSYMSHTEQTP